MISDSNFQFGLVIKLTIQVLFMCWVFDILSDGTKMTRALDLA